MKNYEITKNLDRGGSWHGIPVACQFLASILNASPFTLSYLILKTALVSHRLVSDLFLWMNNKQFNSYEEHENSVP